MATDKRIEEVKRELAALMVDHERLHGHLNIVRRLVYETNKQIAHLELELAELEINEIQSGE